MNASVAGVLSGDGDGAEVRLKAIRTQSRLESTGGTLAEGLTKGSFIDGHSRP